VPVVELWTGGDADLLRQSLRMTNESFAEYLGVAVRTVACWRAQPGIIPRPAIQETLDAALERAPDRARAQFALLAERGGQADRADSPGIPDPDASVPAALSTAQAIPCQRLPADDIDDLLAHVTVTSTGEDVIQQIGQAAICLAESHTQVPARTLLSQVLPLHQRVRSLLGGRLRRPSAGPTRLRCSASRSRRSATSACGSTARFVTGPGWCRAYGADRLSSDGEGRQPYSSPGGRGHQVSQEPCSL